MYYAECFSIDACGFETDPNGKNAVMKAWRVMHKSDDGEMGPTVVARMSLHRTLKYQEEMAKLIANALNCCAED